MALRQSPGRQQHPPLQSVSAAQGMPSPARGLPQFNGSSRPSFPSAANSAPYGAPLAGQKRDSGGLPNSPSSQSASDSGDGSYVKLFVGSVPRNISEDEVRPMFAEHGNVLEVALLKDKNTGQQQGCCFIKYSTFEESERAIRYLHNQRTLPGGIAPVQVRYADGERERLGATEHKLFVGGLSRQASEKEIEEIFAPYGPVDDVYIMKDEMKQSRGCAFVKYPSRDMAISAMNDLNGTYIMRGCEHPLTVKHAVPKRTRVGDTRFGGPGFGGPGFNPQTGAGPYGPRPSFGPGGPMSGNRGPPLGWRPSAGGPGPGVVPRPQGGPGSYSMAPRGGPISSPSPTAGAPGPLSGPAGGPAQVPFSVSSQGGGPGQKGGVGLMAGSTILPQQYFQQTTQQTPQSFVQQSTLQPSQQQLPLGLQSQQQPQLFGQESSSLKSQPQQQQLQTSTMQPQMGSLSSHPPQQFQPIQSNLNQQSSLQPLQQQYAQLQPAPQQFTALQVPQQMQQQSLPSQQSQQQLQQPPLGVHSGAQHQAQLSLSSQTAYQQPLPQLQLQPQLQHQPQLHMQPQLQSQAQQKLQIQPQSQPQPQLQPQSQTQPQPQPQLQTQPQQQQFFQQVTPVQNPLQQQSWMGLPQSQPVSVSVLLPIAPSPTIATCNWSEHTSPEGHKYYYNSVSGESKWEKPDEFTKFEQQQQQQAALPQPASSVSYGAPAATPQYVSQGFTYGQTQLPNGSVNQFRQQAH